MNPMVPLLNVKEVVEILNISEPNIRMKVYKGEIPIVKIGRRCLFRREDIAAIIEKGYRPAKD